MLVRKKVIINIQGKLAELLVQNAPDIYQSCVMDERNQMVQYME